MEASSQTQASDVRPLGTTLRRMMRDDLDAVVQVEAEAHLAPWSEGIFRDCLAAGYCCLVAERGGLIIGHAVMSVAAGECHVLNLCIATAAQRKGIGRRLLRWMLSLARQRNADTAFLEVRPSNVGAIGLYRSEGFNEIGLRKGYYPGADPAGRSREDAVMMARAL